MKPTLKHIHKSKLFPYELHYVDKHQKRTSPKKKQNEETFSLKKKKSNINSKICKHRNILNTPKRSILLTAMCLCTHKKSGCNISINYFLRFGLPLFSTSSFLFVEKHTKNQFLVCWDFTSINIYVLVHIYLYVFYIHSIFHLLHNSA